MARIDSVDALAALMRQQVQALRRGTAEPVAGADRAAARRPEKGVRPAKKDLAAVVARRVAALDKTDPDAPRRAFRLFLEAVLVAELGDELINDAAFQALVDDTIARMSSEPSLAQAMRRASTLLLDHE